MGIEVIPIAITEVSWDTFIKLCNPGAKLDKYYIQPTSLAGYLASLIREGDPRKALRDVNYLLRHASMSFLILASDREMADVRCFTNLTLTCINEDLTLATGTLEEWKTAVIDLSNPNYSSKTRYIMNCCLLFIEKAGLMEVFGNYSKQMQQDQTFILQRKEQ